MCRLGQVMGVRAAGGSLGCSAYTSDSQQVTLLVFTPVVLCGGAELCIFKVSCKTVAVHLDVIVKGG